MSISKILTVPSLATGGLIICCLDLFINGSRLYFANEERNSPFALMAGFYFFTVILLLGNFGLLYGIQMKNQGMMMLDLILSGALALILLIKLLLVLFGAAFSVEFPDSIKVLLQVLFACKFREDPFELSAHYVTTLIAFYWYTFLVKLSLCWSMMITDAENTLAELRLDRI